MSQATAVREEVRREIGRRAVMETGAGDPAWLRARRDEAWNIYEATPLPSTRSEEWRYTDVARLLPLDELEPAAGGPAHAAALPEELRLAMAQDRESAGRIVDVDGRVVSVELDEALAARGVVLASLREAARAGVPQVEALLATEAVPAADGKFAALNAALWSDGVFLYVPRGVRIDRTIRLSRWVSRPGTATFTRILIVAEEHSQLSFVDEILSPDFPAVTLVNTAVELFSRGGAQVQYVSLQRMGEGGFYLANQRTLAERDSTLDTLNVALGGSVGRVDLNARLLGPGANSDMLGLYFGDANQHFDFNTSQDHVAPHAHSDLLYKGALDGAARGIFRGIIRVHEGAQGTDAYQTNRNLILSDTAIATSLPNLEIEADDVRCSHGATVGQLDAEALFYLMSRGLRREQAERLVVLGFLGEVLSKLPLGGVVEKVTQAIEAKLRYV
ncbi:MAG: Fe-S cluster assembly protein SufD [Gemmatimonadetes bacterium]|nr:Fe-S cluster assembly protein SufD [Gemmatimonadota bacterium]MYA64014.1 Fe-S cluster assembly protein SufD [Gemmatimonadota bacterium]MYC00280.1 Fe-S cluster assembly protein SufD [Gemmatimonadota bacterium]MYH53945.1 Fe-S cluster assembly protein SufD [Gemmatimonadota bacterium]MYI45192.1 Fe-S cluster assembly protein SufD [Gemmatimonadota bacterium]